MIIYYKNRYSCCVYDTDYMHGHRNDKKRTLIEVHKTTGCTTAINITIIIAGCIIIRVIDQIISVEIPS